MRRTGAAGDALAEMLEQGLSAVRALVTYRAWLIRVQGKAHPQGEALLSAFQPWSAAMLIPITSVLDALDTSIEKENMGLRKQPTPPPDPSTKPDPPPSPPQFAREGDEGPYTKPEAWMEGLVIRECRDFQDPGGDRWRELRLSSGAVVQVRLSEPWLIIEQEQTDAD